VAYVFATVLGETGKFQPLKEKRANPAKQPALFKQQQKYFPSGFFGRGYVQLTFKGNYENAGLKLAGTIIEVQNKDGSKRKVTIDKNTFVNEPDLVMQPTVAYQILARGMREGWFRRRPNGKPFMLSDFIKDGSPPDYKGARNIINHPSSGADKFAGFAEKFELIMRASQVS
jgi:putative chitinase